MRLLYATLFLVMVSGIIPQSTGDTMENITAFLNEDVILQCNCSDSRNLQWQLWNKESGEWEVFFDPKKDKQFYAAYENRIEVFLNEKNNCSIRLKNVTRDDDAQYKCAFQDGVYKRHYVNLVVPPNASAEQMFNLPPDQPRLSREYFTIIPVIVLLLVVGFLYCKQRRN